MMPRPVRLIPSFRPKVWGSRDLAPWFPPSEEKIGEVWYVHDRDLPILIKLIFTTERLSVQVHPDDAYALARDGSPGKTEMWHILRAEPGAALALGFRQPLTREQARQAALSGEIEQLLRWIPVAPGDTFFTAPGTVHAIGAGIVLCEIQQNTDITYRLYDYGRPRQLHLDKALDVATLAPHPGRAAPVVRPDGSRLLAECHYFVTEALELGAAPYTPAAGLEQFLVVLSGAGIIGGEKFRAGEVWMLPAGAPGFSLVSGGGASLLRTWAPVPPDTLNS